MNRIGGKGSPLKLKRFWYWVKLWFHKHVEDNTKLPCPICHKTLIQVNGLTETGVYTWECKNPECTEKSEGNRGKRFSARSLMMNALATPENKISESKLKLWHRDIVRINPIIKINNKGVNLVGHTAPFPEAIPDMAIRFFTGKGENVLDPFAGSFTTSYIAKKCDRNSIGIEVQQEYVDVGKHRMDTTQQTIFQTPIKYFFLNEENLPNQLDLPSSPYWDQTRYIQQWK